MKRVLVMPYTRPRASSLDSSAMKAWKLGATKAIAIEVRIDEGSSHSQDGAIT
jgi:hypothetical protein